MANRAPRLPRGAAFEQVDITKEVAEEILSTNIHNRNLRQRLVMIYAYDMLKGNWLDTGEAVKISTEGQLLDGQHRLAAVIQAATNGVTIGDDPLPANPDIAVPMWIVRGLDPTSQEAMDTGTARRLSDVLALRGERSTMNLAAVIRIIHAWTSRNRRNIARKGLATNTTLLQFFEQDPEVFRQVVNTISAEYRKINVPPSVLGLAHYLFEEIDPDDAEEFFARLADGQNLTKGDPIYELRAALDRTRQERGPRAIAYTLALLIKAWNAYRLGEKIGVLTFKMGGSHPETYPEPL